MAAGSRRTPFKLWPLLLCALSAYGEDPLEPLRRPLPPQEAEKLARLTPKERAYYERRLKEAMRLYYARAYRAALPLFEEIALRIDTLDILYWLGMSAYYGGRPDIARYRFEQILKRAPDFHAIRLYLAMTYAALGEVERAKQTLAEARKHFAQAESWQPVLQQVEEALRRAQKRLFGHMRLALGFQFDSNPAALPDIKSFQTPSGATIRLGERLQGWLAQVRLNGDLNYDLFGRGGLTWQGKLDFFGNFYLQEDQELDLARRFDYQQWRVASGPSWRDARRRVQALFHVGQRFFAQDHLSTFIALEPTAAFRMAEHLELFGGYRYQIERYSAHRSGQNFHQHQFHAGGRYRVAENHVLMLTGTGTRRQAQSDLFEYWEAGARLGWFASWPHAIQTYIGGSYHHRRYEIPFRLISNRTRDEDRFSSSVMVTKRFAKGTFITLSWHYFHNNANIELYDYRRHLVGINFGIDLGF